MPRHEKRAKRYIVVACEGESEEAYIRFLKNEFKDVAIFRSFIHTNLFEEAKAKFDKDLKYRDYSEVTDEIWFFYDAEIKDKGKWQERLKIIKSLRMLRKKPNITVRILLTTGCIEYWLMLHYEMLAPLIRTEADKDKMLKAVKEREPTYVKGSVDATAKIAQNYTTAAKNANETLKRLLPSGLPCLEDTDERNKWLTENYMTFSTVGEAIDFLLGLSEEPNPETRVAIREGDRLVADKNTKRYGSAKELKADLKA